MSLMHDVCNMVPDVCNMVSMLSPTGISMHACIVERDACITHIAMLAQVVDLQFRLAAITDAEAKAGWSWRGCFEKFAWRPDLELGKHPPLSEEAGSPHQHAQCGTSLP